MRRILYSTVLFCSCYLGTLFLHPVFGQVMEVTNAPPITPQNLITNYFLGEGVEVLNVTYEGTAGSVGFFKDGEDEVGIDRGIVMTTGFAVSQGFDAGVDATGFNFSTADNASTVQDEDLNTIATNTVNNVTKYTITFIPISDTLRFRYTFASEEYPEFVCSNYNDVFGFFISGPGINGPFENNAENIALIPETDLPVTINNVNPGQVGLSGSAINCTPPNGSLAFSQYYNNNNFSNMLPVFDGITDVFIAEAIVQPCNVYTVKLVIADVGDTAYDSGVFLEAKSFGTGSLKVEATTVSLDGSVAEGCAEGLLTFSLPTEVEADYPIDFTVFGTAENGIDYAFIPEELFIAAGTSSVSIPIIALEDGIVEEVETLLIDVQRDLCNRDTFRILIKDNPLVPGDLGPDRTICRGDSVSLDGSLPVPLPDPPTFANETPRLISPHNTPVFSDIQVSNVIPLTLGPDVIRAICIDSLEHRWIDDLDIFLIGPNGQFLELTTDNGGNGGNGLGPDYYLQTCFTPGATVAVNAPGPFAPPSAVPFTGEFLPEGLWDDFWTGEKQTNGTWRLQLLDDTQGLEGTLFSWRIIFNPVYEISYSWSPAAGLSCADCPNPVAQPQETTTYVVTATDSYGCQLSDSVTIVVQDILPAPLASCGTVTETSIEVVWQEVPGNQGYEVNIDGAGWISPSGNLSHQIAGLVGGQLLNIEVRALGDCPGAVSAVPCLTTDCPPPALAATTTDVGCYGGADGTAQITAASGAGPFVFTLNGETNDTGLFTGLAAGSYSAVVLDGDGCAGTIALMIGQPDSLLVNAGLLQPVSCAGAADAAATVTITGGSSPFTFLWSNNQNDSIATDLAFGTHSVTITDANDCQFVQTIEIAEPALLEVTLSAGAVSCGGSGDGFAVAQVSGGSGTYSYQWDAAAAEQVTDTAFALAGGIYQVTVGDENGCEAIGSIEVVENEALSLVTSSSDASCEGSADGSATVTVEGGSGILTYLWQDQASGITVGQTNSVDQLPAGDYTVLVTDAAGCQEGAMVTIAAPPGISLELSSSMPSCAGMPDGTATVIPSGGTPTYGFQWSDGTDGPATRNDLSAGVYDVTVSDANGCEATTSFTIEDPEALTLVLTTEMVTCFGGSDGQALVTASGGDGNYAYTWEDGQTSAGAQGLSAGPILVTVTDGSGCEATGTADIETFPALVATISGVSPACFGENDGTATVAVSGGTGAYQYLWSNNQTGATASGLQAGDYGVTVTDGNNCQTEHSINLPQPVELTAAVNVGIASCNGDPDGTASVLPNGGSPPYTYQWSDPAGQTSATAENLSGGTYTVTVTDANQCALVLNAVVEASPQIVLSITGTDISCHGGNDGTISVNAQGGAGNYTYTWSAPGLAGTANPLNLGAGSYTVTVSDPNACSATIAIELSEPAAVEVTAAITANACAADRNGAINLSVNGGTTPFAFLWDSGETTEDISNLSSGMHRVTITDSRNCQTQGAWEITEPPALAVAFEVQNVGCSGESSGSVRAAVSGGVGPFSYTWNGVAANASISDIPAGVYTLQITDANGCVLEKAVEVVEPSVPLEALIEVLDVSCFGGRDGQLYINAQGGNPPYSYSLDGTNFNGSSTQIGLRADEYRVYVRDARGCLYISDALGLGEPEALSLDLGEDITVSYGDTILLAPQDLNHDPALLTFSWSPKDSSILSCFECMVPEVWVNYQTSFHLIIEDENGCTADDVITVFVRKDNPVFVPTGFTPNQDNINDLLLVHGKPGIKVNIFRIFDRWGEVLYEQGGFLVNDPVNGWDGTFRHEPVNGGVFLWYLEVEYADGNTDVLTGSTTLIR